MKSRTRKSKKSKISDIKMQKPLLSLSNEQKKKANELSLPVKQKKDQNVWETLLIPFKVIRDAVHGDIWITEFEAKIIDRKVFQRLRHIRQLGPTYLVYPDAHHTRFEHCLGTFYMAKKIILSVQRNYKNRNLVFRNFHHRLAEHGLQIFSLNTRDIVMIRIAALLHDAAHAPFGHLLEKEGNVLKLTQWADRDRLNYFFEKCGMKELMESHLKAIVGETEARNFLEELEKILQAIEGANPETGEVIQDGFPEDIAVGKLEHPYIGDIIGNTICADLLDYVLRDSYFTGLRLSKEVRLVNNFAVIGKNMRTARLTLLLVRKARLRLDTLSEAIEFLRRRYFLAERVYYHRVKTSASAMIIDVIYTYLRQIERNSQKIEFLMEYGDDVLLHELSSLDRTSISLEEYDINRVKKIIEHLDRRSLFKPVYTIHNRTEGRESIKIRQIIERFANPEERYVFEKYIENLLGLETGSVIIYVTKKDLGKAARTRCLWVEGDVKPLEDIGKERTLLKQELETLKRKYEELWTLHVFIDKEMVNDWGKYVAGFCKHHLIEINDVEDEELSIAKPLEEWEIYLTVCVPEDVAISKLQRRKFRAEVMALKARSDTYGKLGLSREQMAKVFSDMVSK